MRRNNYPNRLVDNTYRIDHVSQNQRGQNLFQFPQIHRYYSRSTSNRVQNREVNFDYKTLQLIEKIRKFNNIHILYQNRRQI